MIIAPENLISDEDENLLMAKVSKVFDGDGFLGDIWVSNQCVAARRIPFRFAFIDAPEMEQQSGPEARKFLSKLIDGKVLKLLPVFKDSMGDMPLDSIGVNAFDALTEACDYALNRRSQGRVRHFLIRGYRLEFWMFKLGAGIHCGGIAVAEGGILRDTCSFPQDAEVPKSVT